MTKTLEGMVVFATFERLGSFNWTDPATGQSKPLRSVKVLLPHGDGTVTRESLTLPDNYELPLLDAQQPYGFPCIATVRKNGRLTLTLRKDMKPFPAPAIQ